MSSRRLSTASETARPRVHATERAMFAFVAIALLLGAVLARIDPDWFNDHYVIEDGVIEWSTVVGLVLCALVCFGRVASLRKRRPLLFLSITALLGIIFLFGAGEELSWGQRIFEITSSDFFNRYNTQHETNIHNLIIAGVKINKVIFSRGLPLAGALYAFVITPLYRRNERFSALVDHLALPIPEIRHIMAYMLAAVFVETVVNSPKRGELTEFAVAFIAFIHVTYPLNRKIFCEPDAKALLAGVSNTRRT